MEIGGFCPCCRNIKYLKRIIREKIPVDEECQELSINGKIIDNDKKSPSDYGIETGSQIILKKLKAKRNKFLIKY